MSERGYGRLRTNPYPYCDKPEDMDITPPGWSILEATEAAAIIRQGLARGTVKRHGQDK